MTKLADERTAQAPGAPNYRADQGFFTGMSIALALLIVASFGQFALRGYVNPLATPVRVHLHGVLMLAWLGTFVAQNRLAGSGNIALHRKLGRFGAVLVAGIVVSATYTFTMVMMEGRAPPQFPPPLYLGLTTLTILAFAAMVGCAIARRRDTQWHRRLMIGATILLLDPALGRLFTPFTGPAADVLITICQLGFVGVIARHDRRVLGRVHAATWAMAAVVAGLRATMYALSYFPPWAALAYSIGG